MRQRGTIREVTDPHLGTFPIPGMPARFSSEQEDEALTAPLLGQHNAEVLSELLNLSDDEIADLHKDKVLVNDRRVR